MLTGQGDQLKHSGQYHTGKKTKNTFTYPEQYYRENRFQTLSFRNFFRQGKKTPPVHQ